MSFLCLLFLCAPLPPDQESLERHAPRHPNPLAVGQPIVLRVCAKREGHELAQFIDIAAGHYGFSKRHLVVIGYSNGANIAASLIFLHPHYLAASVLFRAQVPFAPDLVRNFIGLSVFLAGGMRDTVVPHDQTEQLAAMLESGQADVSLFWHRGGHELGSDDIDAAKTWLVHKVTKKIAA
jgi:phospholipase/carboxylesterase